MNGSAPRVLYCDNHLLVLAKPFSMPSQSDDSQDPSLLEWGKQWVAEEFSKPGNVYLAMIHRLDRPTGGIMVFGRTSKAAARLSEAFRERRVEKTYYAVTRGLPEQPEGRLHGFLKKLAGKNVVRVHRRQIHASKEAILDYKVLQSAGERGLLEVRPHTGRRHQIRVQLARAGASIVGDLKYGYKPALPDRSIALLAGRLRLEHPTRKEEMEFVCPWPSTSPWNEFTSPLPDGEWDSMGRGGS